MARVIQINNLSKKYSLYHEEQAGYTTLVETLTNMGKKIVRRISHPFESFQENSPNYEEFWALSDVSFDIEEGDRIGIIGRNGAGKSTLLKILSRITEPTSGQVRITGRLSSLIEVGTGFHPELTGRENIYLNGAILGMSRSEIKKKFDEIVAFSEVEKFLDTPVKRYSSGMYMRLGFAIAAHLDSEILIIDEVLAVGDTQFQQKCFAKLNDLGKLGRTILFVSHDIGSILSLCNRGIYLDKGRMVVSGGIEQCASAYMQQYSDRTAKWTGEVSDEHIRIFEASLGGKGEFFCQGEKPKLHIEYELLKPHSDLFLGVGVWNNRHQLLACSHTFEGTSGGHYFKNPGRHRVSFALDTGLFREGEYLVKVNCGILKKKKISDDDIVLKFPVYARAEGARVKHAVESEGVFLGNSWELTAHE